MKIEVGQSYRTRKGDKVTIVKDAKDQQPFWGDNDIWYYKSGMAYEDERSSYDLVAQWAEEGASDPSATQEGGTHYSDLPKSAQPWNVLKHWLTPEEYRGWQKGNAIVYLARERQKGGDLDIAKARHHLQRLEQEF